MRGQRFRRTKWAWAALSLLALLVPCAPAQEPDLSQVSLEELTHLKVTIASKRPEALESAPAAVYVVTQDDIRRSGMTTLPEVLRLAPGVQVAQVAAPIWAVSIRGDNTLFANKLLVLVDGRTVYSPSFSGVFWAEQDIPLDDIERIEVIRGPGATLWGANAVNGVINIITYSAADSRGGLLDIAGGPYQPVNGYVRYGGRLGSRGNYRVYVQHARRGDLLRSNTTDANDDWNASRTGFRSDWQLNRTDFLTVQGDLLRAIPDTQSQFLAPEAPFPGYAAHRGFNLLARWTRAFRPESQVAVQAYVDDARQTYPGMMRLDHLTFDLDVQHAIMLRRHEVVWGGGVRAVRQRTWGSPALQFAQPMRTRVQYNGFAQDAIALGRATLTGGIRVEASSLGGIEMEPTLRLLVNAARRVVTWAAVSRAARTPSEIEAEAQFVMPTFATPWGTPESALVIHNADANSEHLLAYESGVRLDPTPRLHLDLAAYYNVFTRLVTLRPWDLTAPTRPTVALANGGSGRSYGLEATAAWIPAPRWKLTGSYSWLDASLHDPFGMPSFAKPGDAPQHQFQVHASVPLPKRLESDVGLYFSSKVPAQPVPAYARLDIRLGWQPRERWELSVAGQNLAQSTHAEYVSAIQARPILVPRTVVVRLVHRF